MEFSNILLKSEAITVAFCDWFVSKESRKCESWIWIWRVKHRWEVCLVPRMNCRICSAVSASSPASSFSSTYFRMSAFRWSSSVLSPAPRQHSRAASSTARSMVTRSRGCHVSRVTLTARHTAHNLSPNSSSRLAPCSSSWCHVGVCSAPGAGSTVAQGLNVSEKTLRSAGGWWRARLCH